MNDAVLTRARSRVALFLSAALAILPAQVRAQGPAGKRPEPPDFVPLEGWTPPHRPPPNPLDATAIPLSVTTWTPLGPAPIAGGQTPGSMPVSGRIAAIAAHPANASIIYIAAAGGGVWKTIDAGLTWNPLTDSQPTLVSGALALAPSSPSIIYYGTGEANNSGDSFYGRGILKSTDAGASWTLLGSSVFDRRSIAQIAIHPTDPNTLYVAVSQYLNTSGANNGLTGNRGIWKSTDGGANWTNTTTAISATLNFSDVVMDPTNPLILFCAVGERLGATANGVYKSVNGGTSWAIAGNYPTADTTNGRIRIAIAPSNHLTIYSSIINSGTSALYKMMKSTDGGTTWTQLSSTPNFAGSQGWYDTTLIVDPSNANTVYAGGGAGASTIVQSTNGGTSWNNIGTGADGNGPHVDHHAIAFDAAGKLLDGNDGGIWRLDNPAAASLHWSDLNGNLNTTQFIGIALDPTNPDIAFGGSQDNGTSRFNNSLAWSLVEGGDGGLVRVDPSSPSRVYHVAPVGSFGASDFFRRSDDGGLSWGSFTTGLVNATSALFYPPFILDPGTVNRLLLGSNAANVTTDGASNWARLPGDAFTFPVGMDLVAVGPASSSTIYVSAGNASVAGGVWVTTNNGGTWTQRNPAGVSDHFRQIAIDPTTSNTAYLVRDRFNPGGHVFRTTNAGANWTDISGDLPDVPTTCIIIDANGPGTADDVLYVGTDIGVYQSGNLGVNWTRVAAGLPNVRVTDIEINKNLRILAAGTYGRGLWELSLPRLELGAITFSDAAANNDGAAEPGETLAYSVPIFNPNSFTVTAVTATLAGGGPASYGDIPANTTVIRTISYFVPCSTSCGSVVTIPIGINSSLGSQSGTTALTVGLPSGTAVEHFDSVVAPALPAGWTTSHAGAEVDWVTSTTNSFSAPNNAFIPDANAAGSASLVAPPMFVAAAGTHVTFKVLYNMEDTFDGLNLEISNPAGSAFQDILTAGGSFVTGGYNGAATGRPSWTGLSAGTTTTPAYVTTDVILPAAAAGKTIQLRFLATCDANTVAPGAAGCRVDDFPVTLYSCASPINTLPLPASVNNGSPITFSVTASAGAVAYQWRKNGADIGGATAPTYSIAAAVSADAGSYNCRVTNSCGPVLSNPTTLTVVCYPNCDGSTTPPVLNVNDFACFLNRFAAGDPYANCDNSTMPPTLNVLDFSCFLNKFAAGCP